MLKKSSIIHGVSLLPQRVHTDERGSLIAFEQGENVPFVPVRTFIIKSETLGKSRGGHSNSCDELIVAISGSVLIKVDNGTERAEILLNGHDEALWIQKGVLIHLFDFTANTILLVCASERYEDTRHFETARYAPASVAHSA